MHVYIQISAVYTVVKWLIHTSQALKYKVQYEHTPLSSLSPPHSLHLTRT